MKKKMIKQRIILNDDRIRKGDMRGVGRGYFR